MDVWNFSAENPTVPDANEIDESRSLVGWSLSNLTLKTRLSGYRARNVN